MGDTDEAKDVVQEAFIKAFVNLQGFNAKKRFSSWLYRIVHNEAINFLKKKKPKISLEANEKLAERLKSDINIETDFEKKEIKKKVNQGLARLPVICRAPLALFFLEEKSYEEISDVLRVPVGTVGTRISRAKKLLKVILQKNGIKKI